MMTEVYTALVKALLQHYMDSHPEGPTLNITDSLSSILVWHRRLEFFKDLPFSVYQQLHNLGNLAYIGLSNNQQLIFSQLSTSFKMLGLLQEVPQLYHNRKGSTSYNFLHLTVQEFLAALYIEHSGTGKEERVLRGEIVFRHPTVVNQKVVLGENDGDTGKNFRQKR